MFQFTQTFPVPSNSTKIWGVFDNVLAKAVQPKAWPPQDQHSSWLQGAGSAGLPRLSSGMCSFSPRDSECQVKLSLPWFRNFWCPVQPQLHQILKVDTHALCLYQLQQLQWETEVKKPHSAALFQVHTRISLLHTESPLGSGRVLFGLPTRPKWLC